jgi:hypothetical protein
MALPAGTPNIELVVRGAIPAAEVETARGHVIALGRHFRRPMTAARLALDSDEGLGFRRRYIAHAQIVFRGHVLAARAVGPSPGKAAEDAAVRLRRQLARLVDPRPPFRAARQIEPPARVKPPQERAIVARHTYALEPESTLSAIADLLDLDARFHLFSHVRTREDVVVHWRKDNRIGLLFPPGSALADEADFIVASPSRYADRLTLAAARAEMELFDHRFLYFLDAGDGRGRVLYMRIDGDYGVVQPWCEAAVSERS